MTKWAEKGEKYLLDKGSIRSTLAKYFARCFQLFFKIGETTILNRAKY